jgi:hypothetical protein
MEGPHLQMLELFIWGALAALIGSASRHGEIELPSICRSAEVAGHHPVKLLLGFLAPPLLGGLLAAVGSTTATGAIIYGLGAAYGGVEMTKKTLAPLFRKSGIEPPAELVADEKEKQA